MSRSTRKVSGYVNLIRVDIGDRVKTGELIATLEVPELGAELESAVASEKRAESDYQIAHLDSDRLQGVNRSQPSLVAQQDLDNASGQGQRLRRRPGLSRRPRRTAIAALIAYTKNLPHPSRA